MSFDPVFVDENGEWNFWDETWSESYGPYLTEEDARKALQEYSLYLDGELPGQKSQTDLTNEK